jgi:hypothetical protein
MTKQCNEYNMCMCILTNIRNVTNSEDWIHSSLDLLCCDALWCCSRIPMFWRTFTLKMKAVKSSKTLVSFPNTTQHHHAEDLNLNIHCHENLIFHKLDTFACNLQSYVYTNKYFMSHKFCDIRCTLFNCLHQTFCHFYQILKKQGVRVWTGLSGSGWDPVASFEHGNNRSLGHIKGGEFPDQLSDCQFLQGAASWR